MISIWMCILLGCSDSKTIDQDGDGFVSSEDCNDADPNVHPLADEICNDVDDNCDGRIDYNPVDGSVFLVDFDADGFGNDNSQHTLCAVENGYVDVSSGGDCDDDNAAVFPNAVELCNAVDDDCNNSVDDNPEDGTYFYLDSDGDGFGDGSEFVFTCIVPEGYLENNADCDDSSAETFPGSAEQDSQVDCMRDGDGDGYGDVNVSAGVTPGTDCDDANIDISPGSVESCNGIDDDCDLLIDDADDSVFDQILLYFDLDGDGYGDPANESFRCLPTEFLVEDNTDCDDTDALVYPLAVEICDGQYNNCSDNSYVATSAPSDELDDDADGYVDCTDFDTVNWKGPQTVVGGLDCDDTDASRYPTAQEICDGVDNDCDEATLEDGMVYRINGQGVGTDLTLMMTNGTVDMPYMYEPEGDEELYFCEGTFSPSISTESNITIQGFGNVTFLADGVNASGSDLLAVRNSGDGTTTSIDGVVFDGYNLAILVNSENDVYNNLVINDVLIRNGYSIVGAGINVQYVDVEISNSYFEDGASGYGGLAITATNSDITFENVDVTNVSGSAYVGVYVSGDSIFEMIDTNISGFSASGVLLYDSHGICTSSSSSASAGMASSGHGLFLSGSTWDSTGCDYQSSSSPQENDVDIEIASEKSYYVGDNATFSCSETLCGTQSMLPFEASLSNTMTSKVYGNRYSAQADLTIGSFSVPLESSTCGSLYVCNCSIDFGVHTYDQGTWTAVWTGTKTTFSSGYVSSGTIGAPMRAGDQFALTVEYNCNDSLEYRYGYTSSLPAHSLLEHEISYHGDGADGPNPQGVSEYGSLYYDQKVWVETVP